MKDPKVNAAGWSINLQSFTYAVHHRPGVKNQNADALSRRQHPDTPSKEDEEELPHIFAITVENNNSSPSEQWA